MNEFAKNYYDLLVGEYKGINLTRITNYDEFLNKQIVDSIRPIEVSEIFLQSLEKNKNLIDTGFGGGFPILPLAHKFPQYNFYGVETRGKKVKVVSEIAHKLGLKNVKLIHERIENLSIDIPATCTFKAVGKVGDFLNKINTNQNLQVFFYKGPNFYSLEEDQINAVKKEWNTIEEREVLIEGTDKRLIIGYENIKVPCGTKAKSLVKMSELI